MYLFFHQIFRDIVFNIPCFEHLHCRDLLLCLLSSSLFLLLHHSFVFRPFHDIFYLVIYIYRKCVRKENRKRKKVIRKFAATFALHNIVRLCALRELVPEYTPPPSHLQPAPRSPSYSLFLSTGAVVRIPFSFLSPSRALGLSLSLSHKWVLPFTSPPILLGSPASRFVDGSFRPCLAFSSSVGQLCSRLAFLSSPLMPGYLNPQARKAFGDSQRQPLGSRPRFASSRLFRFPLHARP